MRDTWPTGPPLIELQKEGTGISPLQVLARSGEGERAQHAGVEQTVSDTSIGHLQVRRLVPPVGACSVSPCFESVDTGNADIEDGIFPFLGDG